MSITHIAVVMDRSGSMSHLTDETITGFNTWLKDTRKAFKDQECRLSLELFDTRIEWLYSDCPVEQVRKLNRQTYRTGGFTALYDGFSQALSLLNGQIKRGDKALLVVITDGLENASREVNLDQLKAQVAKFEKRKNNSIVYLAANQDAVMVGRRMGIMRGMTVSTRSDADGTRAIYNTVSGVSGQMASGMAPSMTQADYDALAKKEAESK